MPDPAAKPAPLADAPAPLWRNFSFTLMWTSTAASGFGDRMIMLAALALLGGLAANESSTAIQAGTQFFFFLPYIFFSIPGGWLADRIPRKWLLLACDESRGLLLLWSFVLVADAAGMVVLPDDQQWKVYALLFAIGIFAAIFNPARSAIVPQLVERSQLQPANAVVLVINVVFSMIGMLIGGFIISPDDGSSVRTGLLIGSLFYLVSGTFFAFMRPRDPRLVADPNTARAHTSLLDAFRYARTHKRVVYLIGIDVLVWGAAATLYSGVIGLCKVHFGLVDDELMERFTQISAALGFGMLAGAALIGFIRTRRESTTIIGLALVFAGVNVLIVALVPVLWVTFVCSFLVGVAGNVAIVTILSLLQSIVPNYVRGSVMGLNAMVSTTVSVAVYFAIWRLKDADRNILYVLDVLGPVLIVVGLIALYRYLTTGIAPTRTGNLFYHGARLFALVWHRATWEGRHHIPRTGGAILAPNHTVALDPFILQPGCPRMIRWLMLTSYRYTFAEPMWRAIDPVFLEQKRGSDVVEPGPKQVRTIVKALRDGQLLGIFPEGHLQKTHRNLREFEEGVAVMARLGKVPIIPCWISGTPRTASVWVALLRPSHSKATFGEPYWPDPKAEPAEVMAELRRRMLALPGAHEFDDKPADEEPSPPPRMKRRGSAAP